MNEDRLGDVEHEARDPTKLLEHVVDAMRNRMKVRDDHRSVVCEGSNNTVGEGRGELTQKNINHRGKKKGGKRTSLAYTAGGGETRIQLAPNLDCMSVILIKQLDGRNPIVREPNSLKGSP